MTQPKNNFNRREFLKTMPLVAASMTAGTTLSNLPAQTESSASAAPEPQVPAPAPSPSPTPLSAARPNKPGLERIECDVAVIGGGLAGICAAVAAARGGAKVTLIHGRAILGGNASSEIRVYPVGASNHNAFAAETGMIDEMLEVGDEDWGSAMGDFALLDFVRREPKLTLWTMTTVQEVKMTAGTRQIESVSAWQLGSERQIEVFARQFIDCTGDGTIGVLAGADWCMGREGREEHQEPLAPLKGDDEVLGSTIMLTAKRQEQPVPYTAPLWAKRYNSPGDFGPGRWLDEPRGDTLRGYWWVSISNPFHTIHDNQLITDELHAHLLGVWDYLKNRAPNRERYANFALDWIGMTPGKRESRRLLGDYILTEHDCHVDRGFHDRVAYGGWYIDLHCVGGLLNTTEPAEYSHVDSTYRNWVYIPPISIPLRCLYSRNVENLWMAGRNISVTHVGLGPVRVQRTTAAMGQAVGTAAAHASLHKLTPRKCAEEGSAHLHAIQQRLLREDARILDLKADDPNDLARASRVTASSAAVLNLEEADTGKTVALDHAQAVVVPLSGARLDRIEFCLSNRGNQPRRIEIELQQVPNIWDRRAGRIIARGEVVADPGEVQWATAVLNTAVEPGQAHRIILAPTPDVHWHVCRSQAVATVHQQLKVSEGGSDPANKRLPRFADGDSAIPAYSLWMQSHQQTLAVRLHPPSRPFEAENVINGYAWSESMPNLWMSDPAAAMPQQLTLELLEPAIVAGVEIRFAAKTVQNRGDQPAACVRDWKLEALVDGHWKQVFAEQGNHRRLRVVALEPIKASAMRLIVQATNGVTSAMVYELRLYGPPVT